jgi:hypothetical protein
MSIVQTKILCNAPGRGFKVAPVQLKKKAERGENQTETIIHGEYHPHISISRLLFVKDIGPFFPLKLPIKIFYF